MGNVESSWDGRGYGSCVEMEVEGKGGEEGRDEKQRDVWVKNGRVLVMGEEWKGVRDGNVKRRGFRDVRGREGL